MDANLVALGWHVCLKAAEKLDNEGKARKALLNAGKGGATAGGIAVLGGFFFGPPGMLAGGIVGSLVAYLKSEDYEGFYSTMSKMPQDERQQLLDRFFDAVAKESMTPQTLLPLLTKLSAEPALAVPYLLKALGAEPVSN